MTAPTNKNKPSKPHKSYPLFPHTSGQWAKKVNGKLYYFGTWNAPDAALNQWLKVRDELIAGRTPVVWDASKLTVAECLNLAVDAKRRKSINGELSNASYQDYLYAARLVVETISRDKPVERI